MSKRSLSTAFNRDFATIQPKKVVRPMSAALRNTKGSVSTGRMLNSDASQTKLSFATPKNALRQSEAALVVQVDENIKVVLEKSSTASLAHIEPDAIDSKKPLPAEGDIPSSSVPSNTLFNEEPQPSQAPLFNTGKLTIEYRKGNLFGRVKSNTLLVHACNCKGSWGGGIAIEFRKRFRKAYSVYRKTCLDRFDALLGKALLIKSEDDDNIFIGCLFTSTGYGRAKLRPQPILEATRTSMLDLLQQVAELNGAVVEELRMPKINSGLFGVKWEATEAVLESLQVQNSNVSKVVVYEL